MSQTSPLYNLTPNVKTQITVTAQANRIRAVNDSSLYLRVYFGADAPILATDPGWHDTISPGDKPLLWITGGTGQTWWAQSGNPSSTPFTGVITFLPFIPVGALLSSGGIITGAALLYITAFSPDETADRGGQTEAFVQGAKQGRYQAVVPGAIASFGSYSGHTANTDQSAANEVQLFSLGNFTPAFANNHFLANAQGISLICAYIFLYHAEFNSLTPGQAGVQYFLRFRLMDVTLTVTRAITDAAPLYSFSTANFASDYRSIAPAFPLIVTLVVPQNALQSTDVLIVSQQRQGAIYGQFALNHSLVGAIDYVNQSPLTEIVPPIGINLSPPWQPYNPQTY